MGSSNVDYRDQINRSLNEANLPKSPLSGEYSNLFGNAAPGMMQALMNVQSLGNSFINSGSRGGGYNPLAPNPNGMFSGLYKPPNQPQQVYNTAMDRQFQTNGNMLLSGGGGMLPNGAASTSMIPGASGGQPPNLGNQDQYRQQWISAQDQARKNTQWMRDYNPQAQGYSTTNPGGFGNSPEDIQKAYDENLRLGGFDPSGNYIGPPNQGVNQTGNEGSSPPGFSGSTFDVGGIGVGGGGGFDPSRPQQPGQSPWYTTQPVGPQYPFDPSRVGTNAGGTVTGNEPPGSYGPGPGGGGMGGGVSTDQYGNPTGVNIPGLMQAFGGDPMAALNALASFTGGLGQQAGGMNSYSNPAALQAAGQYGPGMNNLNLNPNIQNILNGLDKTPGQVQAGFNPTSANLSGIASGTQLTPENSQYMDAITQILNQQGNKNIADTRERAIQTGTSRSTGASYDEAQLRSAQIPQLAAALQSIRQPEVANQLQSAGLQQQGALANAGMQNQYGLGGAQLTASTALQNVANLLQSQGLGSSNLSTLLGANQGQNQLGSQNYFGSIGALQNQFGVQNQSNNTALQGLLGQGNLLGGIGQSNAAQGNAYNLGIGGMNQQASQFQITNALQQLASLFGQGTGLAATGIPGGSANVNIGNTQQGGNAIGSGLDTLGSILKIFK